ncbi:PDPK1 [Symbiodinium pilosum]|uniref:non-specific serine/threonine protein kinase n=1 Tax=Symbiodinium pilosum TaxID=2952 RepID=A0A812W256_SYMPI|nr:PDPK1 [Symbiodinium pilosum]
MKVVEKKRMIQVQNRTNRVMTERLMLLKMDHPGIVRMHFAFQDAWSLYFGLELVLGGDLATQIDRMGTCSREFTRFYTAEIVSILGYLRLQRVAHRDLKPENLLLTSEGRLKLVDFDAAMLVPYEGEGDAAGGRTDNGGGFPPCESFVGTALYVAPEVLLSTADPSQAFALDLWALGCIVYLMLVGHTPFHAESEYLVFQRVQKVDYSFPPQLCKQGKQLIEGLLQLAPQNRTGAGHKGMVELEHHDYFSPDTFGDIRRQAPPSRLARLMPRRRPEELVPPQCLVSGPPDADLSATSQAEAAGLSAELLTEVRWLTHLATTQDERATEDDWRLLALLLRSAGFNKALSPLAPRAQLDALSFLQIDCKAAGQLLASQSVDLHPATNSGPDAAGLVLHGSLQLLGAAPGQASGNRALAPVHECPDVRKCFMVMILVLCEKVRTLRTAAIAIEERRATRRRDAAEAIRSYLASSLQIIIVLCHVFAMNFCSKGLVKSGTSPDGFRILLHGTAAVSTCEGNRCLPLRCIEAWFCEDEPLEPWELCLTSSAGFRRPRDIVALSESCDVIFLPRAESGVICDALRDGSELRRAALKALVVKSRSEDEAIQPRSALLCDCPLLQAQDNYWRSLARKRRSEAMEKMQLSLGYVCHEDGVRFSTRGSLLFARADAKLPSPSASLARQIPPMDGIDLPAAASCRAAAAGQAMISWHESHHQVTLTIHPHTAVLVVHSRAALFQVIGEMAAQSWAEELAGALVEGLLALSPSISNSSLRLLPRRGRRELCRQTELWRTARGEVLRGERSENVMVILRGQVGVLEKDPELDDLPPAILQGLGATAARLFRSADVPVTEQVQTWLQTISSEEAMGSSMPLVDGADSSQRDLAASLLETMIYRYKEIFPPSQHGIPQFLKSAFLDQTFLGDNAYWVVKDQGGLHKDGSEGQSSRPWADSLVVQMDTFRKGKAKYLDISAAGHLRQVLSPGDLLLGAGQQTLVAIEPRTDILMMDPSALSTWLEEIAADTFFAPALADGLQKRAGSQLAAKDFAQLSQLLLRYEIFENLENRSLRDICRSTQFVCIDQGELICQAGQKSSAFIQILSGSAVAILPSGEQQQLPQGSAIGEDVLLGLQEHWPFSLRADTDVKLAWLQASAFKEASMDLSGEAAARRRVLEALGNRPTDLSDQDPELLHSVFKVPVLQQLDYDQRLEVAKEATLHRISKGGTVDLPKGDSLPFFVVLKGVVGRYEADVTASPTSVAEESQEASCEQEDTLRAQEEQREKLRLEKDTAELTELQQRLRLRPLDVSLQDRLRYHSLKIQVDQLREELANQDAQVGLQEVLAHQEPDVEPIEQPPQSSVPSRESFAAPILQQAANMSAARHSGVFLTMINPGDADAASVTSETAEDMNDVLAEFAEGDFFGGWFTSVGPSLYRAHKDSVLLSISEAAWNDALQRCAVIRRAARGKLLRESFACDDETAEKLLPLFKEETRRKGCVLVKAGQVSSSLWLIAGGRCSQAAAAPKPIHEEWPANEENQTGKRVGTPKTKRRFFSSTVELGLLEAGQLVGLTSVALQQPEPLTVTTASPEVKLLRADNLPQAKLTPKVLEALRSALRAKATWLGQRLESLSELPAKLSRKAEKMHAELERAKTLGLALALLFPVLSWVRESSYPKHPPDLDFRPQQRCTEDAAAALKEHALPRQRPERQLSFPGRNLHGVAAGGGLAAKEAFKYNRENFLWDRTLRRRKEFQIQSFRVDQAELWRKDVRDLISLTEYKMHVYLLVNVLLLGITVALWCQGKLPHTTPVWLMTGSALAMAGSFSFILLSIWMAMHAAISAQSFETRLLTQMVRLPIPTWQEIEACRTYASEFERLEAKQMFRIPFAMGAQESLAEETEEAEQDAGPRVDTPASSRLGEVNRHVDPWGLEGSGSDIPELGCKMGHSVQKLRHVKLARQAMVFWQSYDAFARICMSIGVNQLLNAASYFILAYYMSEVKVPSSATYGVVVLTTMAETLNRLDMSLTWWQLRLMQLFLYLGPAIATLAGWAYVEDGHDRQAEGLVVCAFLAHALYLTTMNTLCRMHMEHNGARLPAAFRSVLYLDVFGWTSAAQAQANRQSISHDASESHAAFSEAGSDRLPPSAAAKAAGKPATGMVEYAETGQPRVHRPEEMSAPTDYSNTEGAPHPQTFQDLVEGDVSEFYNARSWLSTTSNLPEDSGVVTGCERSAPIVLPQQTFSFAMNMLCFLWLSAALYYAMDAAHVLKRTSATYSHSENETLLLQRSAFMPPWTLSFFESGPGEEHLTGKDMLSVSWPYENVLPQGLACDAAGQLFLVSDGLMLFSAAVQNHSTQVPPSAVFDEAPCPPVLGEGLVDVAVDCASGRCEALVLHSHGKRLSSCRLGSEELPGSYRADVSDSWLEELRVGADADSGQPHARVEKAVTLTADSWCKGHSAWAGCVLLGTSRGRVVRLAEKAGRSGRVAPVQALVEREENYWLPGAVRALGDHHFAVLAENGTRLHVHRKSDGHLAGNLTLDAAASGFCAGGGHLYFLEAGPSPRIWRLPLPRTLGGAAAVQGVQAPL